MKLLKQVLMTPKKPKRVLTENDSPQQIGQAIIISGTANPSQVIKLLTSAELPKKVVK